MLARPHWRVLLPALVWAMVVAAVAGGALAALGTDPMVVILAAAATVWLVVAGRRVMRWRFARHILTSERIIARTGVVARSGTEIPLTNIDAVHYRQRMFERVIGCGTLVITPVGSMAPTRLANVRRPAVVQSSVWQARERRLEAVRGPAADPLSWRDDG